MPLLGRLPVIRSILGGTTDDFERTEVIIFIRPTVLQNPEEAENLSSQYIETASEKEVIKTYLKENSTSDLYLEGSVFEKKEPRKRHKYPSFMRR